MKRMILLLFLISSAANANLESIWTDLVASKGTTKNYPKVIKKLVDNGMYFTSIPYIKEYLANNKVTRTKDLDLYIDKVITKVGVKQFEILPTRILSKSNSPTINYILGKKYFRKAKYKQALELLKLPTPEGHPVRPFSLFIEAAIYSITKKYKSAVETYDRCEQESNSRISDTDDIDEVKQLKMNRDYCILGKSRTLFAAGKFDAANLAYLDLPKSSFVWPEILFEEAWNSFYQQDYNRTLGKLVTYNAPILDYIFNPEIDVLTGLTYMELCLWDDAKKVVDNFYDKNYANTQNLKRLYKVKKRDYKYYYLVAKNRKEGKLVTNDLMNKVLKSVVRDPAYLELFNAFNRGNREIKKVKSVRNKRLRKILSINLKDSLVVQRDLAGAYVRKSIAQAVRQLDKTFKGMSYMKLEVLSRRKQEIYRNTDNSGKRGDIKYLNRTDKQYFWSFNGEFWADELGDYVFSLKSECRE